MQALSSVPNALHYPFATAALESMMPGYGDMLPAFGNGLIDMTAPIRPSPLRGEFRQAPFNEGPFLSMDAPEGAPAIMSSTGSPSAAASLGTLASVAVSLVGIFGQLIVGGSIFGITATLGLSVLAAIVLAHSR
jgi:hypothetical protein